jgi:hypothetical protein
MRIALAPVELVKAARTALTPEGIDIEDADQPLECADP